MTGPTFAPPAPSKPAAPRAAAKPAPRAEPEGGGMKVFAYLRLHWLMILFCGTLLGGGAAYLAWDLLASKYESYALLRVASVQKTIGSTNPNQAKTDFATYMKTTAGQVKYEFVLNAALRDIKDLPTIKAQKDPIKFLEEELQVSASDGSEVIRVSMKGHNPADVQKIVNAVQAAFLKEVIGTEATERKARLAAIEAEHAKHKTLVEGKAIKPAPKTGGGVLPVGGVQGAPLPPVAPNAPGALPQLRDVDPIAAGPRVVPGAVGETAFERLLKFNPRFIPDQLAGMYVQAQALPGQLRDVEVEIKLLEQDVDRLKKTQTSPNTLAQADAHPDVIAARMRMDAAKRDHQEWASTTNNPDAPAIAAKRKRAESAEAMYHGVRQEKVNAIEGPKYEAEALKLKTALEAAHRRKQAILDRATALKVQIDQSEKVLMTLPVPEPIEKAGFFRRDETGKTFFYDPANTETSAADSIFAQLSTQLYLAQMESAAPPRVTELQKASSPTQRDVKKQIIGTVFAGLLGYGLIAMGVIAVETMARRVSSLSDAKTAGPAAVVGVIPCQPNTALGRDPVKRAAANEAIDKLRAYVSQSWLSRGATAVAVTSPVGEEGKAFTAFGLASSLAQAGYKTLLADFDLRDPALHAFAGVPNVSGICELLRGEAEIASSVQFLPSGLHLVPAGKWSDEARKAATGERLETLLGRLKEPYDVVVLNGHAILTAAESVEVARRCEVVLVCAMYRETTTPLLKRAVERVGALEIPYSGVVYVGATEQEALC